MTEKKKNIMDTEYGIDTRYKSNKERKSDATALMEARLLKMKNLSKNQITKAKLLHLFYVSQTTFGNKRGYVAYPQIDVRHAGEHPEKNKTTDIGLSLSLIIFD